MCGTEPAYGATRSRARQTRTSLFCEECGTELAYGAMQCAVRWATLKKPQRAVEKVCTALRSQYRA
eukprot:2799262-Rhodomonas_salina.1